MSLDETSPRRLAVFVAFSGAGGVESGILHLLSAFLEAGIQVDLLGVFKSGIPHPILSLSKHPRLRMIDLRVRHTALSLPKLVHYLRRERPHAMLAAKDRAIRTAVIARAISRVNTRLVGQLNTHLSASLAEKPLWQRWSRTMPMRWFYPFVDEVVAVSHGVAEDTQYLTGLPLSRIPVIRNPVIDTHFYERSQEAVEHPWCTPNRTIPLIIGAGRLTQQKDFPTLLKAFAEVKKRRDSRLVILGEGRERSNLEKLVEQLGLTKEVFLPGHVSHPLAWIAKADVFVLSSRWEGSGNVLTEAMALGVSVVATDCPSGPAEMLEGITSLVCVGDHIALARKIEHALTDPLCQNTLRNAVSDYTVEKSAQRYLQVLRI